MHYTYRMGALSDETTALISQTVHALVPDAHFVALFGSFATESVRPFSDIDLALCVPDDLDVLVLGNLMGILEARTERAVDVVLVRGLPERDPELAFAIARDGVPIAEYCSGSWALFKKQAFLYYMDTEHLRSRIRAALRARVLSGNMGRRNFVLGEQEGV